jgi:hypothetical protein
MKRVVLALALLGACAPPPDLTPIPGQASFMAATWSYFFQRTDAPPAIEWAEPDCHGGEGITREGTCVMSWYQHGDSFVQMPRPVAGGHPDWTSLCHELAHVIHERAGAPDLDHSHPDFAPGGRVDQCAEAVWNLEGRR